MTKNELMDFCVDGYHATMKWEKIEERYEFFYVSDLDHKKRLSKSFFVDGIDDKMANIIAASIWLLETVKMAAKDIDGLETKRHGDTPEELMSSLMSCFKDTIRMADGVY